MTQLEKLENELHAVDMEMVEWGLYYNSRVCYLEHRQRVLQCAIADERAHQRRLEIATAVYGD